MNGRNESKVIRLDKSAGGLIGFLTKGLLVPEGSLGVFSFLQLQTADLTADFSPGAVEQKAVKEGEKRGFLISGGEINTERAAITVLDEFRGGKLGRITLERP